MCSPVPTPTQPQVLSQSHQRQSVAAVSLQDERHTSQPSETSDKKRDRRSNFEGVENSNVGDRDNEFDEKRSGKRCRTTPTTSDSARLDDLDSEDFRGPQVAGNQAHPGTWGYPGRFEGERDYAGMSPAFNTTDKFYQLTTSCSSAP